MTEILNHHNNALQARLEEVKTLPLAEQLLQYGIGISEVLAFISAKRQIWKAFQEGPRLTKLSRIFRMKECNHLPSQLLGTIILVELPNSLAIAVISDIKRHKKISNNMHYRSTFL